MPIRELLKHSLTQSGVSDVVGLEKKYKNMSVTKMQPFSDDILCNKEGWTEEWDEMVNATFASGTGMTLFMPRFLKATPFSLSLSIMKNWKVVIAGCTI